MKLFKKEKDLLLKVTNLVLLIWLISSFTVLHVHITELIFYEDLSETEKYYSEKCNTVNKYEDTIDEECANIYIPSNLMYADSKNDTKKYITINIGNTLIVMGVLYMLNKGDKYV